MQIDIDQLLIIANHSLTKKFFDVPDLQARESFESLRAGESLRLIDVRNEKNDLVKCYLFLEHKEFVGDIDFDLFKSALASTLQHTSDKLNKKEDLNIMQDQENEDFIFHIPGVCLSKQQMNVMVIGAQVKPKGILDFKLHFLDPKQYEN